MKDEPHRVEFHFAMQAECDRFEKRIAQAAEAFNHTMEVIRDEHNKECSKIEENFV